MSPEERQAFLLDAAKNMIEGAGLDPFTIDGLARSAGVSTQLVYHYFGSRPGLLIQLLSRELHRHRSYVDQELQHAGSLEEVVRVYCTTNYDHRARGTVIAELLAESDVAAAVADQVRADVRHAGRVLAKAFGAEYRADAVTMELILTVGSGASVAAADVAARRGLQREATIDRAVTFIMAGVRAVMDPSADH